MEAQRKTQNQGKPHVPEKLTPTPAVNLRVDIHFLAQGLEETGSVFVGKSVQQPKQFPVDASARDVRERARDGVSMSADV